MKNTKKLRVIIGKPSKYAEDGFVERFYRGFMPNATINHMATLVNILPKDLRDYVSEIKTFDEYCEIDLAYYDLLCGQIGVETLFLLVGVQSHQFQRAIDLAAFAKSRGVQHVIIGGPHVMTCDTSLLHGRGISFSVAEGEVVMRYIVRDALEGELACIYGLDRQFAGPGELNGLVVQPPDIKRVGKYVIPMVGLYPFRGCNKRCTFCSVPFIAGGTVRDNDVESTIESLKLAKAHGVKYVMFTSDNFNQSSSAVHLLEEMIAQKIDMPFFAQCDSQIERSFIKLMGRAKGFMAFFGLETFNSAILKNMLKGFNRPVGDQTAVEKWSEIVRWLGEEGIAAHLSNIIGHYDDTPDSIDDHVTNLLEVGAPVASFYILCMIPGSPDYKKALEAGQLIEPNLDRYDTQSLVWKHPTMSSAQLRELLFDCYKRYSSVTGPFWRSGYVQPKQGFGSWSNMLKLNVVYGAFARWAAIHSNHPMSGGLYRKKLDSVREFEKYRQRLCGDILYNGLLPLPKNLAPSPLLAPPTALTP